MNESRLPDGIPAADSLAESTRRALRLLARTRPSKPFAWGAVQARARRVRRLHVGALVTTCAVVLAGTGTALAAVSDHGSGAVHPRAAMSTTTSTVLEAATTTSATTSTTACARATCESVGGTNDAPAAPLPPAEPVQRSADPVDTSSGSWTVTMSAGATTVPVGGTVKVHARVRNVGSGNQATYGYGSLGISCQGGAPDYAGAGAFMGGDPFAIGEERTVTYEFRPDERFLGAVTCTFGIGYHGSAEYASPTRHVQVDVVHITVLAASTTSTSSP